MGRSAREESCGLHLCNANVIDCKDPAPDRRFYCTEARKNMCMNSGLCYCNPHFGGSTCEIEFGQPAWNATTKTFETLQCRPDFAAGKPYDFYHPHCFYHNLRVTDLPNSWRLPAEQLKPPEVDWPRWDFWTCATFNPCSGAGTCVDSGNLYEPPRCVCYDGFFGSRPQEMEAFARTFECAGGTENLQYWSDTDRHDMRRYMMTHQCLLWNGRDGPRNYKLRKFYFSIVVLFLFISLKPKDHDSYACKKRRRRHPSHNVTRNHKKKFIRVMIIFKSLASSEFFIDSRLQARFFSSVLTGDFKTRTSVT